MKFQTRFASSVKAPETVRVDERFDTTAVENELLAEAIALAGEPLVLEDTPRAAVVPLRLLNEQAYMSALDTIAQTHRHSTDAISALAASAQVESVRAEDDSRSERLVAAALDTVGKLAGRPAPAAPDIHVHMPEQDLRVTVEQPEFKPQINVEGARIEVPERSVQVDVHVPEQQAPEVHVAAAQPEIVVQAAAAAPAPIVNVTMPDTIRTIAAETETVAERDQDDLIVRSVTRPTGG